MQASFERRRQEWEFQRELAAEHDWYVADKQITIAQDHTKIVEQEQAIAQSTAENAQDVIAFLQNEFTSAELYNWMSGVVGDIYRYFLQQATVMAKLAQTQLVFERQEPGLNFILSDYWTPTTESYDLGDQQTVDRRGMTGSARLLQDVTKLEYQAFLTDQRKLQLSKTISLATLDPVVFQQFRETGVLPFALPMALFDHDFPGHYLRLIKRVRTSVVALIPPTEGIKATLSTGGLSRVIRNGAAFESVEVIREPEQVALTSPLNATGLFELQEQPEMLLPFEGNGVDTSWEFRMPKAANPFDYRSIADVLVTLDYTALDSWDYRQHVIKELDRSVSADRPFSFRHQFPDAWYDLHNPASGAEKLKAAFETRREDFPPNVNQLTIQHITMYFARNSEASFEVTASLRFMPSQAASVGDAEATSVDGVLSTRGASAPSWGAFIGKHPAGQWELTLPLELKEIFREGQIEDILFAITYSGETPEWPQ